MGQLWCGRSAAQASAPPVYLCALVSWCIHPSGGPSAAGSLSLDRWRPSATRGLPSRASDQLWRRRRPLPPAGASTWAERGRRWRCNASGRSAQRSRAARGMLPMCTVDLPHLEPQAATATTATATTATTTTATTTCTRTRACAGRIGFSLLWLWLAPGRHRWR